MFCIKAAVNRTCEAELMELLPTVIFLVQMLLQKLVQQMKIMIDGYVALQIIIQQFVGLDLIKMNQLILILKIQLV